MLGRLHQRVQQRFDPLGPRLLPLSRVPRRVHRADGVRRAHHVEVHVRADPLPPRGAERRHVAARPVEAELLGAPEGQPDRHARRAPAGGFGQREQGGHAAAVVVDPRPRRHRVEVAPGHHHPPPLPRLSATTLSGARGTVVASTFIEARPPGRSRRAAARPRIITGDPTPGVTRVAVDTPARGRDPRSGARPPPHARRSWPWCGRGTRRRPRDHLAGPDRGELSRGAPSPAGRAARRPARARVEGGTKVAAVAQRAPGASRTTESARSTGKAEALEPHAPAGGAEPVGHVARGIP